jgi:hypothetical protein
VSAASPGPGGRHWEAFSHDLWERLSRENNGRVDPKTHTDELARFMLLDPSSIDDLARKAAERLSNKESDKRTALARGGQLNLLSDIGIDPEAYWALGSEHVQVAAAVLDDYVVHVGLIDENRKHVNDAADRIHTEFLALLPYLRADPTMTISLAQQMWLRDHPNGGAS